MLSDIVEIKNNIMTMDPQIVSREAIAFHFFSLVKIRERAL